MFIDDSKTRKLLRQFCTTGVTPEDFSELLSRISVFAPCLCPLMEHIKATHDCTPTFVLCLLQLTAWKKFLIALSSTSPVCALIHPTQELFTLLRRVTYEDIRKCLMAMQRLQQEVPVLFDLLSSISSLPSCLLSPVIESLIKLSKAPFENPSDYKVESQPDSADDVLSYFPDLPRVRPRNTYCADKKTKQEAVCTKNSSGHPSLLPGIFSMFCQHGKTHFWYPLRY